MPLFGLTQWKERLLIQSYGMLVRGHLFLCLLLEVLWYTSLKVTVSKYVFLFLPVDTVNPILLSDGRFSYNYPLRLQHQCKRRLMASQTILIFLLSWFACFTVSLYMYENLQLVNCSLISICVFLLKKLLADQGKSIASLTFHSLPLIWITNVPNQLNLQLYKVLSKLLGSVTVIHLLKLSLFEAISIKCEEIVCFLVTSTHIPHGILLFSITSECSRWRMPTEEFSGSMLIWMWL